MKERLAALRPRIEVRLPFRREQYKGYANDLKLIALQEATNGLYETLPDSEEQQRKALKLVEDKKDNLKELLGNKETSRSALYTLNRLSILPISRRLAVEIAGQHLEDIGNYLQTETSSSDHRFAETLDLLNRLIHYTPDSKIKKRAKGLLGINFKKMLEITTRWDSKNSSSTGAAFASLYEEVPETERNSFVDDLRQQYAQGEGKLAQAFPGFVAGAYIISKFYNFSEVYKKSREEAEALAKSAGMNFAYLDKRWASAARPDLLPVLYTDNFKTIALLEQIQPGICAALQREFGVTNFGKATPQVWLEQYQNRNNNSQPTVIEMESIYDWNRRSNFGNEQMFEDLKLLGVLPRIYEFSNALEGFKYLQDAYTRYCSQAIGNQGIPTLIINLHASKNSLALGPPSEVNSSLRVADIHTKNHRVQNLWQQARSFLAKDAFVVISGCEAGQEDGFAQHLSAKFNLSVLAAKVRAGLTEGLRFKKGTNNTPRPYLEDWVIPKKDLAEYKNGKIVNWMDRAMDRVRIAKYLLRRTA